MVTLTCRCLALTGLLLKVAKRWAQKDLGNQRSGQPELPGNHAMAITIVIITAVVTGRPVDMADLGRQSWRRKALLASQPCRPPQQTCTENSPNCFPPMPSVL